MSELARTIAAQAGRLRETLAVRLDAALETLAPTQRLWIVGTGTSHHAAELGAWMFAGWQHPTYAMSSASFTYRAPVLRSDDGVIVISHTTETAYARRARAMAIQSGAALVTITGVDKPWPEAIQTVPSETSETYTTSYTAALLVLARLAVELATPGFGSEDLSELPGRADAAAADPVVLDGVPERLMVLCGLGPAAITAREGALKLREGARIVAEGFEAEYLLHGSAVPLTRGDVLLGLQPPADDDGLLDRLLRAGQAEGLQTQMVREPDRMHPVLAQIPLTVRLQGLAAAQAAARGVDPDRVIVGEWADTDLWAVGGPPPG